MLIFNRLESGWVCSVWEPARPNCCTDFLCTLSTKVFSSSPTSRLKNCESSCVSKSFFFLLPPHGYFWVAIFSSIPFVRLYGFTARLPLLWQDQEECVHVCVHLHLCMSYAKLCVRTHTCAGCLCVCVWVLCVHTFMYNCWWVGPEWVTWQLSRIWGPNREKKNLFFFSI